MLKAVFLDLDETLIDTTGANRKALEVMAGKFAELFPSCRHDRDFVDAYLKGIYRDFTARHAEKLLPIEDEGTFRLKLIRLILADLGIEDANEAAIAELQASFDDSREGFLAFFPGIEALLLDLHRQHTLVVITNGPEFSQLSKIRAVNLDRYVDHIIIGGQEPEQKPAPSIFYKALQLAGCEKEEAIHVGDSLKADIAGARNAGVRSIWISHGQHRMEGDPEPDYTIATPLALRDLLMTHSLPALGPGA